MHKFCYEWQNAGYHLHPLRANLIHLPCRYISAMYTECMHLCPTTGIYNVYEILVIFKTLPMVCVLESWYLHEQQFTC